MNVFSFQRNCKIVVCCCGVKRSRGYFCVWIFTRTSESHKGFSWRRTFRPSACRRQQWNQTERRFTGSAPAPRAGAGCEAVCVCQRFPVWLTAVSADSARSPLTCSRQSPSPRPSAPALCRSSFKGKCRCRGERGGRGGFVALVLLVASLSLASSANVLSGSEWRSNRKWLSARALSAVTVASAPRHSAVLQPALPQTHHLTKAPPLTSPPMRLYFQY